MKSLLIEGLDQSACSIRLANFSPDEFGSNRVHLHTLVALRKGGGRHGLEVLCKNADDLGITLSLNACPTRTHLYPEAWNVDFLVKWYENFGFKRATPIVVADTSHTWPSHNSPFWLHMSHLMLRQPQY